MMSVLHEFTFHCESKFNFTVNHDNPLSTNGASARAMHEQQYQKLDGVLPCVSDTRFEREMSFILITRRKI